MSIRPPSNFEHRSDPHRLNAAGSTRLNPGASVFAADWMGRMLLGSGGEANLTPHPRAALPWARTMRDAGTAGVDPGPGGGGCGCGVAPRSTAGWASAGWAAAALLLGAGLRRRRTFAKPRA